MAGRLRALWFFVSALPTPAAILVAAAFAVLAHGIWHPLAPRSPLGLSAGAALLVFGCLDWVLLAALPRLRLSFGPVGLPLFLMALVRLLVVCVLARVLDWTQSFWGWPAPDSMFQAGWLAVWLLNAGILIAEWYGLYIEPFDVRVTPLTIKVPAEGGAGVIRLVHLTDLHIERTTKREREVLKKVEDLKPDIVALTGDYLNGSYLDDPTARRDVRWFLSRLAASSGIYAVTAMRGDTPEAMAEMFGGLDIRVLRDEACKVEVRGIDLWLVGVSYLGRERDRRAFLEVMEGVPADAYSVLLHHTTGLARAAREKGVGLYLTGHTHGGQMRLPLFGALFTNIRSWKKYEQGMYRLGRTSMYVNRGLGMEGKGGPRARLLCRPEILAIDLHFDPPT